MLKIFHYHLKIKRNKFKYETSLKSSLIDSVRLSGDGQSSLMMEISNLILFIGGRVNSGGDSDADLPEKPLDLGGFLQVLSISAFEGRNVLRVEGFLLHHLREFGEILDLVN